MPVTDPTDLRRTGVLAAAGGVLLTAGVGVELLAPAQDTDGSVVRPLLFTAYLLSWTAGAVALTGALAGLRRAAAASEPGHRAGRASACGVVGAALLGLFGVVVLGTGLVQGTPYEAAFLLFAVGLLLLLVGEVAFSVRLRRTRLVGAGWPLPLAAAAGALLGVVVPTDPWHDLGLLSSFLSWSALGLLLLRRVDRSEPAGPGSRRTQAAPVA